jgi:hypothetical protein
MTINILLNISSGLKYENEVKHCFHLNSNLSIVLFLIYSRIFYHGTHVRYLRKIRSLSYTLYSLSPSLLLPVIKLRLNNNLIQLYRYKYFLITCQNTIRLVVNKHKTNYHEINQDKYEREITEITK